MSRPTPIDRASRSRRSVSCEVAAANGRFQGDDRTRERASHGPPLCTAAHRPIPSGGIQASTIYLHTTNQPSLPRHRRVVHRKSAVHEFLSNNRDELIARCRRKVEQRPKRAATTQQLAKGIPLFLEQLTRTLRAEEADDDAESLRISGPSGGDMLALSEMGVTATAHGKELLEMGYAVDQVVHDYGDLCQSITDLAFERDVPFAVDEFRTLNRCLDNAIADAVTEFSFQREANVATQYKAEETQRTGFLVHELRNSLSAANLSLRALEVSNMPVSGATGALLKRKPGCDGKSDRRRGQRCTKPRPRTSRNLVGSLFHCRCQGCRPTAGEREGLRSRRTGRRR